MSTPSYLNEDDHRRVSDAVAQAEHGTAGEIVTILADRSDGYSDVALVWAAMVALAALCALAIVPEFYLGIVEWFAGGWIVEWTARELLVLAAGVATIKFGAMVLLQLWTPLKFLLIPSPIKAARVRDRAVRAFRIGAERRTTGRTGILIYLSMREHRAEIVADAAIAAKVAPDAWGDAMAAMIGELKDGRVADGMIAAIGKVGAILAENFPRADDDQNELPDRLIEV
ncbi:TPM domain-containing protein [Novosphingobium album (ex Liu et al. 2023)]|uniref:TPM domain-containing protein n=1 Tax=Novosphingobium album (ex Liu et al. 2023) TaxID=3031130 RepID=A0ABT5WTP4_9SPHN|nr:hypothetical protein [Novosphingobium album (ex Liu et al. 2023)]MDE8653266.1 hypothetical protein [Novosphingobium album (ex Liu et al. 2023)]